MYLTSSYLTMTRLCKCKWRNQREDNRNSKEISIPKLVAQEGKDLAILPSKPIIQLIKSMEILVPLSLVIVIYSHLQNLLMVRKEIKMAN